MTSKVSAQEGRLPGAIRVFLIPLLCFALSVWFSWDGRLDLDVAYFAGTAKAVSEGLHLYEQVIDANPPGPVLVGIASYAISNHVGAEFDQVLKVFYLTLNLVLCGLVLWIFAPALRKMSVEQGLTLTIGVSMLFFLSDPLIGKRDLVGALLLVPWAGAMIMRQANQPENRYLAAIAGAFGGLSMMFKPHFALMATALALLDLVHARGRIRKLSFSTFGAAVSWFLSYTALALMEPAYFKVVIPFAMETFGRLSQGFADPLAVVQSRWFMVGLPVILLSAIAGLIHGSKNIDKAGLFAAAGTLVILFFAALLQYSVQGFGLKYQALPVKVFYLALIFAGLVFLSARYQPAIFRIGAMAILILISGALGHSVADMPSRRDVADHPLVRLMSPEEPGKSVLMVSPSVKGMGEVYIFLDAKWAGVSLVHWPLATLIKQDGRYARENHVPEDRRQGLADWYRGRISEIFAEARPQRVAFDVSGHLRWFEDSNFDILAWLREDPGFDQAWRDGAFVPYGDPIAFEGRLFQVYKGYAP